MSNWQQIHLNVDAQQKDLVEVMLFNSGAIAITEHSGDDSEIFERYSGQQLEWPVVRLTALFEEQCALQLIVDLIGRMPLEHPNISTEEVDDQDWEKTWLTQFKPVKITDDLWVCPSWCEPVNPDAINLMVDPGMAFGTGTHETTRLCLGFLQGLPLNDKTVIDYGCGTGILAIAAIKLGAKSADAVDNDHRAVTATLENAQKNDAAKSIDVYLSDDYENVDNQSHLKQADIVIANILSETILMLKERLINHTAPDGHLILSGILQDQSSAIMRAFGDEWQWQMLTENRWVALHGQRDS